MRMFLRRAATAAALAAVVFTAGCATNRKKGDIGYVARDVDTLYSAAKDRLDRRQYTTAAVIFDEVERQHPYSPWARRAQLMSAFSYYMGNDYTKSIESAQRFLSIHPGNKDAPYAYYLIALDYYEQISDVTRDQKITQQALDAMNDVIRRYPDTRYAGDARLKIDLINDHLGGKEMEIGRFYQRRGQWLAATIRFRRVVDDYQSTSHTPEALERLTESYLALGIPEEAKKAAAVLGTNYPGSKWYERAYALMQKHGATGNRMLLALSIRDVVLIEALDLEFANGLTVITGETGAGKSILLDALGLALGVRAASGLVRQGVAQASVTATFARDAATDAILADNDIAPEPGEPLIVRRTVKADGGSRAFVNDVAVSGALLRTLGERLVEVHGQHDDRGLLAPAGHRALLDAFARADLAPVRTAFAAMRTAEAALAEAQDALANAEADRDWLIHAVAELDALGPEPGEEEALATSRAAMQKGAKIADDLEAIDTLVAAADGGLSKLRQAARALDRIASDHPLLAEALGAVDRAIIEGAFAEDYLRGASEALAFDPARLEAEETRLFDLRAMARKHRVQPDDLAALADELRGRLSAIEAGGEGVAALERAASDARAAYRAAAEALSEARKAAAVRLDAAVAGELMPLKLDAARFRTVVAGGPESENGTDRVEFEVSTNPGAPFGPLLKIASGGELSRFILALKVALAEEGAVATMIFDEIDRGVGGAVASAIGDRLSRLAAKTQLLVVTHSPQVAARGAQHLLIAKNSDGLVTRTNLRTLEPAERREEIARMLSGTEVTDEARAQAARLVAA